MDDNIELLEEVEVNYVVKRKLTKKAKTILVFLLVLSILLISVGGSFLFLSNNSFNKVKAKSFFLKGDNNLYAIFDGVGNKLSDFVYKEAGSFIDGSSLAIDKNGVYSIISNDGKTIVPAGKYSLIERKRGIYIAKLGNNSYILDKKGKEKIKYTDGDLYLYAVDNLAILKQDSKWLLIDNNGDVLSSYDITGKERPLIDYKDGYISLYYDNHTHIINFNSKKEIASIDDKQRYCVSDVNNLDNIIVYSCVANFDDTAQYNYKVINSGGVSLEKNSSEIANLYFSDNNLLYSTKENEFLLDESGKEKLELDKIQYIDSNNYAIATDNGINIYVSSKKVAQTECKYLNSSYANVEIYLLENCNSIKDKGYYAFYNKNGEKIGKYNFSKAVLFDSNNRSIVSTDDKYYYLIDTKGNAIGKKYTLIEKIGKYYIGIDSDKSELLDSNGKVLIKGDSIVSKKYDNYSIILVKNDKKYVVYNLDKLKTITSVNSLPILEDNYFIVKDKKTNYYSYLTGKKFYSSI